MWSQSLSPDALAAAARALTRLLPAPAPAAPAFDLPLGPGPAPEDAAAHWHNEPGFLWLDGGAGRHLLLRAPLLTLTAEGQTATAATATGSLTLPLASLDLLEAATLAWRGPAEAYLAGWLSYDIARELEPPAPGAPPAPAWPRLHLALYDAALIAENGHWRYTGSTAWGAPPHPPILPAAIPPEPAPAALSPGPLAASPASFPDAVARLVARIHAGDLFQTNLCRHLSAPLDPAHHWELYRRLRRRARAPFGAYLPLPGGRAVLSASPELFLRVRSGVALSEPIKGTRPRGATPAEDEALLADLLASAKDRAELAMIVDVTRNDLGRLALPGAVHVDAHAAPMTLPTLHHTVSRVSARLAPGSTIAGLLRATFPPASISGAPKIAAVDAALAEEGAGRGPAMGAIGWISLAGDCELSVAIRTAYAAEGRVHYLAGCGITAASDPAAELAESRHKAAAFVDALGLPPESDL